jgi:hypothetical protein
VAQVDRTASHVDHKLSSSGEDFEFSDDDLDADDAVHDDEGATSDVSDEDLADKYTKKTGLLEFCSGGVLLMLLWFLFVVVV